jgi:hypothetical protein
MNTIENEYGIRITKNEDLSKIVINKRDGGFTTVDGTYNTDNNKYCFILLSDYLNGHPVKCKEMCNFDCAYNYFNVPFRSIHRNTMDNIKILRDDDWIVLTIWECDYDKGGSLPDSVRFE